MNYKHLSVRVPWHDSRWRGTVCSKPADNASCLFLTNIGAEKDAKKEQACCGKYISELAEKDHPPCLMERGCFMSPKEIVRHVNHPYKKRDNPLYSDFLNTQYVIPPYTIPAVPFRWTMKNDDDTSDIAKEYEIETYSPDYEPAREDLGFSTIWVQDKRNQEALLKTFFKAIVPEHSLCFIYAKHVPFSENVGRYLIGVGRVTKVQDQLEYDYEKPRKNKTKSVIWETIVHHTIREDAKDGFLLPYHDLMGKAASDSAIQMSDYVVHAPSWNEYSYASEHISHSTAIDSLLLLSSTLKKMGDVLGKDYQAQIAWVDDRLSEIWKMRGAYPGLGAVLKAFGIESGNHVAWSLAGYIEKAAKGDPLAIDPWTVVDEMFADPAKILSKEHAKKISKTLKDTWKSLPPERRSFLKLLSRMEINNEQAALFFESASREENGITHKDADFIENPYLFFEAGRYLLEPLEFRTVDKAMLPEKIIRDRFPLAEPSLIAEQVDRRRVRALAIQLLEEAADNGNSLFPATFIVSRIKEYPVQPPCPVTGDIMSAIEPFFKNEIKCETNNDSKTYQLQRLSDVKDRINEFITKRKAAKRLTVDANWETILTQELKAYDAADTEEKKARQEKVAALKELAESRFSVLIGSAGTGKTTLLSMLCNQPQIKERSVLLLVPTGKARVKMMTKIALPGQTLAQFLLQHKRYDDATGRYLLSDAPKYDAAKTVIVDEASMLTEEQLGALIDALQGVERFILVGDHRQLPPIGVGRPFLDIINFIKPGDVYARFPRVAACYAELTVVRRQKAAAGQQAGDFLDLKFAQLFSGVPLAPQDDNVVDLLLKAKADERINLVQWETSEDLVPKVMERIVGELKIGDKNDFALKALGGTASGNYVYFNPGAEKSVESWQILGPTKPYGYGIKELNRVIQKTFREDTIKLAVDYKRKSIPKPLGTDRIVYGDKVINIRNHRHYKIYPKNDEALKYIANGEIGIATGKFRGRYEKWNGALPLNVCFSSQPGYSYSFYANELSEETEATLELAYALTVHKAQGSDFELTMLVLPNPCPLLSRELLYTALTRHRNRVIVFHQGDIREFKKYSYDNFSEMNRRITNLFRPPDLVEIGNKFFEKHLIHRTSTGIFVRSKSEVVIAELFTKHKIEYSYEKKLVGKDGSERYPDFTIEDADTGEVFYWEHLGMLADDHYRAKWQEKKEWYDAQDILPAEKGGGKNGTLVTSQDARDGSIDAAEITSTINRVILKK